MRPASKESVLLFAFWLVLVVVALFGRSYIPIDETRYVTVAWNMWLRDDYLVPWLNGTAYSHKPPLLFWLMNAGWAVFGVNDWWPRLVPSLFALGSVFLTTRLARMLWPQDEQVALMAPVILLGSALWMVFTTATMFDTMTAFFSLLGVLGVLNAWQGKAFKGWALFGLALGGGLLAKGPAIFLSTLPAAVLAPWWGRGKTQPWKRWYLGLLGAIGFGAAIALAWAIPAAIRGGDAYRDAIFWGQTANRMVNSFAHKRPLWWYLPMLPIMLFPWLLWPPVWRGFNRLRLGLPDMGVRLCLAWLLPTFIAFSLISGKQMHYLLPIFPAFALLAARGLVQTDIRRPDQLPLSLVVVAVGAGLLYLPYYAKAHMIAPWIARIPAWASIAVMLAGVSLLFLHLKGIAAASWKMTLFSAVAVTLVVYVAIIHSAGLAYDMRELSVRLKALQDAGIPLAHVARYPGQYQFLGRLKAEPEVMRAPAVADWFKAHPDGKAVVYFKKRRSLAGLKADYWQPYLGENVVILGKDAWPPVFGAAEVNDDD